MLESRKKLPAWQSREQFLSDVASSRAMVVTGETGCGKSKYERV
jgi:HrpA-like RNA helicase